MGQTLPPPKKKKKTYLLSYVDEAAHPESSPTTLEPSQLVNTGAV